MVLSEVLLPEFEHEMAGLRRVMERIPPDQLAFRPHPKSSTLSALANHLAALPHWAVSVLTAPELDFGMLSTRAQQPASGATVEEILRILDAGVEAALEALSKTSDDEFHMIWRPKNAGTEVFAVPRIAAYRGFVMNHLVHHRGQLTVYLRLLGAPLPSLYGPKADES